MEGSGDPNRDALRAAIGFTMLALGIDYAGTDVLERLTELLHCMIMAVGKKSKSYCESAGRSAPNIGDLVSAFGDLGLDTSTFNEFAARRHTVLHLPQIQAVTSHRYNLRSRSKRAWSGHKLPLAVVTPIYQMTVLETETEKAVSRILAPTSDTNNVVDLTESPSPPLGLDTTNKQPSWYQLPDIDYESILKKVALEQLEAEKAVSTSLAPASHEANLVELSESRFPRLDTTVYIDFDARKHAVLQPQQNTQFDYFPEASTNKQPSIYQLPEIDYVANRKTTELETERAVSTILPPISNEENLVELNESRFPRLDTTAYFDFDARNDTVMQPPQNTQFAYFPEANTNKQPSWYQLPEIDYEAIRKKVALEQLETEKAVQTSLATTIDEDNVVDLTESPSPPIIQTEEELFGEILTPDDSSDDGYDN